MTAPNSTPHLGLPYVMPDQAQKHVSVNESLHRLDSLVQLSVTASDLSAPPPQPAPDSLYIVAANASGNWTGYDGQIAGYIDEGWTFYAPKTGWRAWVNAAQTMQVFDGTLWQPLEASFEDVSANFVGINTATDTNNRLAVASPGSLFTHVGDSHQVKINRHSSSDTSALLFQTDYTGAAEIGLLGSDAFEIKLSSDGTSWDSVFVLDPVTQFLGLGRPSPSACIDVKSQVPGSNLLRLRAGNGGSLLSVDENGSKNLYVQIKDTNDATNVQIHANGKSFFTGGDVGVGTSSPTAPLHVDGVMRLKTYDPANLPSAVSRGAGAIAATLDGQGNTGLAISDGQVWKTISAV